MQRSESGLSTFRGDEGACSHATIASAVAVATLVASPLVLGEEIRINGGDCIAGVHLVARDAHLSDVLKRLSQSLDFQLSFEADSDPLINVDAAMRPGDVARLAPDGNISATQSSDPRCPGQTRIVKLWVLSSTHSNPQRPPSTVQPVRQIQEPAAQADKTQEAVQSFLTETHGFRPGATAKTSP